VQLDLTASVQRLPRRLSASSPPSTTAPTPNSNASDHTQNPNLKPHHRRGALPDAARSTHRKTSPGSSLASGAAGGVGARGGIDAVRTMVSVCLLELIPFAEIDVAALARRLQSEMSSSSEAKWTALADLATELGGSVHTAVALALRRIVEDSGGLQIDEAFIGTSR
jgi:mRNA m6A methyltransferase catalytic subunit